MVTELEIDKSKRDIPLARVVYAYPYEEMDVGYFFTSIFMMCNTYFISTFISVSIVSCGISTNVNGVVNC